MAETKIRSNLRAGSKSLISISEAARRLRITRVTIYKWISMGVLKPQGHQAIGLKHLYWFDPEYLERVAPMLPKNRRVGVPLLTPQLEEKLKRLT